jgi:hypothetical protein
MATREKIAAPCRLPRFLFNSPPWKSCPLSLSPHRCRENLGPSPGRRFEPRISSAGVSIGGQGSSEAAALMASLGPELQG